MLYLLFIIRAFLRSMEYSNKIYKYYWDYSFHSPLLTMSRLI